MSRGGCAFAGVLSCALVGVMLLGGCVTPIEVKTASQKQLQLIRELDSAVADLQGALADFHRQKEARILQEGRVLIAQQAIATAVSGRGNAEVTADMLFENHKNKVQPWIDYALADDLDAQIRLAEKRKARTNDPLVKGFFDIQIGDLRLLKATLANKPQPVKELEAVISEDLEAERTTAKSVEESLTHLRGQLALMSSMAESVDAWLAIDVSPSAEQVNALRAIVAEAAGRANGGGQ